MKKLLYFFVAILLCNNAFTQTYDFQEWKTPEIISKGCQKTRSINFSYDNRDEAVIGSISSNRFYMPLNEGWSELSEASNIDGNITTNKFTIPETWIGRDIFLNIGRGSQSYYISLNGETIGYVEDSKLNSQFKINKTLIIDKENTLSILFLNSSTSSEVEKEKITKEINEVYLFLQPRIHIKDVEIESTLNNNYTNGLLEVNIEIANNFNIAQSVNVGYDIVDDSGEIVTYNNRNIIISGNSVDTLYLQRIIKNVKKWSCKTPNLYTIIFRVKHEGRMVEYIPFKVGFKTFKATPDGLFLNGDDFVLKGHSTSYPDQLKTEDISKLKNKGVNTLYHNEQPISSSFYELCDKMGLLIIENINIGTNKPTENRKIGGTSANNPKFLNSYLSRATNSYYQFRNHTSVIMWSLGDSIGNGFNLYRTYNLLKELDSKRLILNKGAKAEWNTDILTAPHDNDKRMVIDFNKENNSFKIIK